MKKITLRHQSKRILATLFSILIYSLSFAQAPGSFRGKIIERTTKQPISGVSVRIDKTSFGTVTDTTGSFVIVNIPAATYSVTISAMGFQTKNISEIEISHNKTYYSEIELLEEAKKLDEVTVNAIRYKGENNPMTPVSAYSYSREEIFRNPGAQGDIMRALSSLPGVVSSGAQFSAIAARGQGTRDNVYVVDDIPMFNLSHLEAEGFSSGFNDPNGGRFSIFAPRIIDNVQFQNGGFDAVYGRRSSSYLNLAIKEGNKETWSAAGQFDLLGGTLIFDGPVLKKTGMFASARYQNFGALIQFLDLKNAGSVSFGDYLVKTTTELNAKNKLSFVAMYNPERPYRTVDDISAGSNLNDDNSPGILLFDHKGSQAVVGLNVRTLLTPASYIKNILYFRSSSVNNKFGYYTPSIDSTGTILDPKAGPYENDLRRIKNNQQEGGYRSIYTRRFNRLIMTVGVDAMVIHLDYARTLKHTDTIYSFLSTDVRPGPSQYYEILDPVLFNSTFNKNAFNGSGYVSFSWKVTDGFTVNPGVRYDYTGFNGQHTVSPRISGSIALDNVNSINFASGIYYQDAAYSDIAGQSGGNKLKNERSFQSILGYKMQFSSDLKFVAEGWYKHFDDLTVQPNRAQSYLTSTGTGYAYGADVSLTKRLSGNYYGTVSYSYMRSKRDDHINAGSYDHSFSIPHTISLLGSYKPSNKWIFSGKFRYSTGRPTDAYIVHSDVFNDPKMLRSSQEITAVNGSRLPDYYSLDIRIDYNVQMRRGIFSAFVDLVDVTNRFNVNSKIFLANTGRAYNFGLATFPTFGVRIEF